MKVIKASTEILEDKLAELSIEQRIEHCGRICYKSEDKITSTSAPIFVGKMLKNKHMSTLEMAVVSVVLLKLIVWKDFEGEIIREKYVQVEEKHDRFIITGSVRAFLEIFQKVYSAGWHSVMLFLKAKYPSIFGEVSTDFTYEDAVRFARPHEIPYAHKHIAVRFIVNRAVTHELVRHRPCTFLQESQRYCRYSDDKFGNEVTFIAPTAFWDNIMDFEDTNEDVNIWISAMEFAEKQYFKLLEHNSPQAARTVLPNSCKTEIILYANMLEWEHIFTLRTSPAAEPSMREVMIPLYHEFKDKNILRPSFKLIID